MTKRQKIIDTFRQLGFSVNSKKLFIGGLSTYGTIKAEPIDTGKNHFSPKFRDVFFGEATGGYYITSHIHGTMRQYRHRYSYETDIANIFGHGKTVEDALENFAYNFINKIYNIR